MNHEKAQKQNKSEKILFLLASCTYYIHNYYTLKNWHFKQATELYLGVNGNAERNIESSIIPDTMLHSKHYDFYLHIQKTNIHIEINLHTFSKNEKI